MIQKETAASISIFRLSTYYGTGGDKNAGKKPVLFLFPLVPFLPIQTPRAAPQATRTPRAAQATRTAAETAAGLVIADRICLISQALLTAPFK
jgi:hypothetical protein